MDFNFIDFAIIILLMLGALNGFRQGFIGSLVGFLGSIAALLISIKYYKPFAGLLNEKFGILSGIHGFLTEHLPLPLDVSAFPVNNIGLSVLEMKIETMVLPEFIKKQVIEHAANFAGTSELLGLSNIGELLTYLVAVTLLNGLALLLLWVILNNVFLICAKVFSKSLDNTFLGSINRLGGLFVGTVLNALGLVVFIGIFTLFLQVTEHADSSMLVAVAKTVNQSTLVPFFQEGYKIILGKIISLL
ncbi:MAG: CvpA family protein [Bacillota bacterium]